MQENKTSGTSVGGNRWRLADDGHFDVRLFGHICRLQIRTWLWRMVTVFTSGLLVLAVALSRVYIEAHYLSDVLAAIAAGCAWLTLCLLGALILKRRKLKRSHLQLE
jgi:membrane-associated phospholipid phosphatase